MSEKEMNLLYFIENDTKTERKEKLKEEKRELYKRSRSLYYKKYKTRRKKLKVKVVKCERVVDLTDYTKENCTKILT